MGLNYAYVSVKRGADGPYVSQTICKDADKQTAETETPGVRLTGNNLYLRVRVREDALCNFSYSADGKSFAPIGESFSARQGRWIGAKIGIFAIGSSNASQMGYADFDWFRVE